MGEVQELRDQVEALIRRWHVYEVDRGGRPVIDFDCSPDRAPRRYRPVESRLEVYQELTRLRATAAEIGSGARQIGEVIRAHRAYAGALLGRRDPLYTYLRDTQGCDAEGWPEEHILQVRDLAVKALEGLGVRWGRDLNRDLLALEQPITGEEAAELIPAAARSLEPVVRELVRSTAKYSVRVQPDDVDDFWAYWLDGAGQDVRLRINQRYATFTMVQVRQFALHELLGHALQYASYTQVCAEDPDVPWVRLMSVNLPYQFMLEGLAQALPLFVTPSDAALVARVRLAHYLQLVRGELHLAVNAGVPLIECANHARARVPYWTDATISDTLTERSANPLLRSYLWSYPAGLDWWAALADSADDQARDRVLQAVYRRPLSPVQLERLAGQATSALK
ncbi:hypothetical protein [Kineosporia babensis]|uniref:Uncharacterized protein n=1 Tax=Kineosporia babensis TaxID=499548 RepID=A0A9X1NH43_9ACTN|nr:hypothetical protein [Kineosporia babensis]MCD5313414.1 hypothetical protein [Kineosporia babensis]